MRIHSTPHAYFLSQLLLSIFSLYHLLSQSILCFSTLVLVKIDLVGIPPHNAYHEKRKPLLKELYIAL